MFRAYCCFICRVTLVGLSASRVLGVLSGVLAGLCMVEDCAGDWACGVWAEALQDAGSQSSTAATARLKTECDEQQ